MGRLWIRETPLFTGWYDPEKKKSSSRKLDDAIARYREKWGEEPQIALVNAADFDGLQERDDIEIRIAGNVAPSTFFVGVDEDSQMVLS